MKQRRVISAHANQIEAQILEEGGLIHIQGFGSSRVDIRIRIEGLEVADD